MKAFLRRRRERRFLREHAGQHGVYRLGERRVVPDVAAVGDRALGVTLVDVRTGEMAEVIFTASDFVKPGTCTLPPEGWFCSLGAGHDGPCPTRRDARTS